MTLRLGVLVPRRLQYDFDSLLHCPALRRVRLFKMATPNVVDLVADAADDSDQAS